MCSVCCTVIRYVVPEVSTHPRKHNVQLHCSDNLKLRSLKKVPKIRTQNLHILNTNDYTFNCLVSR
jgi:hypothetical protein